MNLSNTWGLSGGKGMRVLEPFITWVEGFSARWLCNEGQIGRLACYLGRLLDLAQLVTFDVNCQDS